MMDPIRDWVYIHGPISLGSVCPAGRYSNALVHYQIKVSKPVYFVSLRIEAISIYKIKRNLVESTSRHYTIPLPSNAKGPAKNKGHTYLVGHW